MSSIFVTPVFLLVVVSVGIVLDIIELLLIVTNPDKASLFFFLTEIASAILVSVVLALAALFYR